MKIPTINILNQERNDWVFDGLLLDAIRAFDSEIDGRHQACKYGKEENLGMNQY